MTEFFAMGGKAVYVWTAYALGAGIIAWNITVPLRRRRRILHRLRRLQARERQR